MEESHHHNDVCSPLHRSESINNIPAAIKQHRSSRTLKKFERKPTWDHLEVAAKRHYNDQDKTQIKSGIVPDVVEMSDFNFLKLHLLNHFSDHICHHGNLFYASSGNP
jgi:hypothetical protein